MFQPISKHRIGSPSDGSQFCRRKSQLTQLTILIALSRWVGTPCLQPTSQAFQLTTLSRRRVGRRSVAAPRVDNSTGRSSRSVRLSRVSCSRSSQMIPTIYRARLGSQKLDKELGLRIRSTNQALAHDAKAQKAFARIRNRDLQLVEVPGKGFGVRVAPDQRFSHGQVRDGLPKVHGRQQVEAGSQGPTAQGAVRQCRES